MHNFHWKGSERFVFFIIDMSKSSQSLRIKPHVRFILTHGDQVQVSADKRPLDRVFLSKWYYIKMGPFKDKNTFWLIMKS